MSDIVLLSHQHEHARRMLDFLQNNKFAIDLSPTGTGKTYVSLWLANQLELPVIVFCPKNVVNVWKSLAETYDVELQTVTYDQVKNPKHGWVTNEIRKRLSEEGRDKIYEGHLFIADEAHKLKNPSYQSKAMQEILGNLIKGGNANSSKVLLLSATLIDGEKQAYEFWRLLGYHDKIRNSDLIRAISPSSYVPMKSKEQLELLFDLFKTEIIEKYGSSMKQHIKYKHDVKNMSRRLPFKDMANYRRAIKMLSSIDNIGHFVQVLNNIQDIKASIVIKTGLAVLRKYSRAKLVLFADYHSTQNIYVRAFREYDPMLINGRTKDELRIEYIDKFQEDSNERRVMIMSTSIGNLGISLHDIHGKRPRFMFLMPGYKSMDLQQSIGRIFRSGTKSNAFTRVVYGPSEGGFARLEQKLMEKVWAKSNLTKSVQTLGGSNLDFMCDFKWDRPYEDSKTLDAEANEVLRNIERTRFYAKKKKDKNVNEANEILYVYNQKELNDIKRILEEDSMQPEE